MNDTGFQFFPAGWFNPVTSFHHLPLRESILDIEQLTWMLGVG
jgi:hypothetical protein